MRRRRRFDYYCQERKGEEGEGKKRSKESEGERKKSFRPSCLCVFVCMCVRARRRECVCARRAFRIATASRVAILAPPWPRSILSRDQARNIGGAPEQGARHTWGRARASAHSAPNARLAHVNIDSDGRAGQVLRTRNTQRESRESHVMVSMKT